MDNTDGDDPNFNTILDHVPALAIITSRLSYKDLKNLSRANRGWWHATHDEIVKRSNFKLGKKRRPLRNYKSAATFRGPGYKDPTELPSNLPLDHLYWAHGHVDPRLWMIYPKLKSLETLNCAFLPGTYDCSLQNLTMTINFFQNISLNCNMDRVVFKDLVGFKCSISTTTSCGVDPYPLLCGFLANHPRLREFALEMCTVDQSVYEALAIHENLETLELKSVFGLLGLSTEAILSINSIPKLSSLKLTVNCNDWFKIDLEKLHTFQMDGAIAFDEFSFSWWLPHSPKMKSFQLNDIGQNTFNPTLMLSQRFSNLVELSLGSQSQILKWNECDVVTFPNLRWLQLTYVSGISKIKAPKLETLRIVWGVVMLDEIDAIPSNFPNLKSFTFKRMSRVFTMIPLIRALTNCNFMKFQMYNNSAGLNPLHAVIEEYIQTENKKVVVQRESETIESEFNKIIRVPWLDYCFL